MPHVASVKGLTASFEKHAAPRAIYPRPSKAELATNNNMFPKKSKGSIDTVLATSIETRPASTRGVTATPAVAKNTSANTPLIAPAPVRPVGLPRPFWIGPPRLYRPRSPGIEAMKQSVTVEYSSPGAQPPVYVFTSLSEPQWSPVEMDSVKAGDGEYCFRKTFTVEEGDYQYKFRLGPGDWWALNESAPVVDDGDGNKNNLLEVKPPAVPLFLNQITPALTPQPVAQPATKTNTETRSPKEAPRSFAIPPVSALNLPHTEPQVSTPALAPLMKHELPAAPIQSAMPSDKAQPQSPTTSLPASVPSQPHDEHQATTTAPAPLLKHETFFQGPTEVKDEQDTEPDYSYNGDDDGDEQDGDSPPLLRHESFAPSSAEQTQAPLLRHESMAIGEHDDEHFDHLHRMASPSSHHSSEGSVAPEADPDDPTLEKFPTDQLGIFEHIHRVSTKTDDDHEGNVKDNSHIRPSFGETAVSSFASLPSVQEDDEELGEIRDYEREKANQAGPITPPLTPKEMEKVIETVLAVERAEEIIEKAIEAKQAELDGNEMSNAETRETLRRENTVFKSDEKATSLPASSKATTIHPMSWVAIAGVAMALAIGVWKLR